MLKHAFYVFKCLLKEMFVFVHSHVPRCYQKGNLAKQRNLTCNVALNVEVSIYIFDYICLESLQIHFRVFFNISDHYLEYRPLIRCLVVKMRIWG